MEPRREDPHGQPHRDADSYSLPRIPLHRPRPSEQWFALGATPEHTPDLPQLEVTPPVAPHQSAPRKSTDNPFDDENDDEPEPPFGLGISDSNNTRHHPPPPHAGGLSPEIGHGFNQERPPSPSFPNTPTTPLKQTDFLLGRSDHSPSGYHSPHISLHPDQSPYEYASHSPGPPAPRRRRDWSYLWSWFDPSWVMYEMLLIGIILAVGHHVFYSRLDGRPADDQLQMMRYGNFLSYAAKSFLATSIIFAYKQQIWATVRRNNLELGTIDSLFSAVDDLRALLNWDFAKRAKVALGLAIIFW